MFAHTLGSPCLIDTHCHLDAPEFTDARPRVVAEAITAGVGQIVVPAIATRTFADTLAMRNAFGCWVAFGLHPIYLDEHIDDHLSILDSYLATHNPVAVGEIGLDFFVPELDPARQEMLFVEQLKLARKYDLPVILHVRRSQDRILKYLRQVRVEGGIAHAFNGSEQQAHAFIQLGFKLGFGGAMTFSGSKRIRHLAASLPLTSLVLETDAPDIRPEWEQNRPNVPANIARFATILADLRHKPEQEIIEACWRNSMKALGQHD